MATKISDMMSANGRKIKQMISTQREMRGWDTVRCCSSLRLWHFSFHMCGRKHAKDAQ